jgi:tetratricopeptide (TPR) repeat protein
MICFKEIREKFEDCGATAFSDDIEQLAESVLAQIPPNKNMAFLLSDICMGLERYDLALLILGAIESGYGLTDVGCNNVGYCLWGQGKFSEALSAYEESLKKNPENISSVRGAAYCAIEADDPAKAVYLNRKYYELSNCSLEATQWLATALFNNRNDYELSALLREKMQDYPGDSVLVDLFEDFGRRKQGEQEPGSSGLRTAG